MKKTIYLLIGCLFLISSCVTKQNTVKYTIASKRSDCVGVTPQKCLLVKRDNASDWQNFYGHIEGFNYQEGNEYVLNVTEEKLTNVPADASSVKYVLVKEVSKRAIESANLPTTTQKAADYQWVGKVLSIDKADVGRGAAQDKFEATVLKIQVSSSQTKEFSAGDIIYAELAKAPKVTPKVGGEYAFRAKYLHPAHVKGVYMLDTRASDLVR